MKNGGLFHHELITSHEELIDYFGINDSLLHGIRQDFVRIEFLPEKELWDIENYRLSLDEENAPEWYESLIPEVTEKLKGIIQKMIITGDKKCIIGGGYILKDAKVDYISNCIIYAIYNTNNGEMRDSSKIGEMWDSSNIGEDNRIK